MYTHAEREREREEQNANTDVGTESTVVAFDTQLDK